MPFIEWLRATLNRYRFSPPPTTLSFPDPLLDELAEVAAEEGQTVVEVAHALLDQALLARRTTDMHLVAWESLTPREQQTAALACLGYTNQEIANRMVIATSTVKTHMRHVLHKFGLNRKSELQIALGHWDFSSWLAAQDLGGRNESTPSDAGSPR